MPARQMYRLMNTARMVEVKTSEKIKNRFMISILPQQPGDGSPAKNKVEI